MWNRVPGPVKACCETLWEAGYAAHPVGGCVRDLLLGRRPGDWDLCSSALPEAVMSLFRRTVPTGLKHGTVTVLLKGMALEVTTFRREEGFSDGRRPDAVSFDATLPQDLSRRDFTINAMALDQGGGTVDPFGGREDLARRLVRCVGDPDRRFQEDGLRMFRAIRFAAQLGFAVEEETLAAIGRNAALAERLSGERIKAELEKILLSPRPELAALPTSLGLLVRFGAAARPVDLAGLSATETAPIPRWTAFCAATGLDITTLPVERALRRAVLHPEQAELAALALTGTDLCALGYRGAEISALRRRLADHVRVHPEDNNRQLLIQLLPSQTESLAMSKTAQRQ